MPPRPPFNQASVRESDISGETPYTITLVETFYNERWELHLDASLGSPLAAYVRSQQAASLAIARQQVVTLLMS